MYTYTIIALIAIALVCGAIHMGDTIERLNNERDAFILTIVDSGMVDQLTPAQVDRWIVLRNIPQIIARGVIHAPTPQSIDAVRRMLAPLSGYVPGTAWDGRTDRPIP